MRPPRSVLDGKLTVPLFHGTSSLFYESILETGLGGRNMVEELGLRKIAPRLLELGEERLQTDPDWPLDRHFLTKIAPDPSTQTPGGNFGFNFRYGGTYVTPSRQTAATYALLNKCGSEALACTQKILDKLLPQVPSLATQEPISRIVALAKTPRQPILVEACDVPVALLRAEQGGSCSPCLEFIEHVLADPDIYDMVVQQANFELLAPIPASQLRFYKIVSPQSGYDSLEDLRLDSL